MPLPQELRTARLILTPLRNEHEEELHTTFTRPEVRRYLWDDIVIERSQTSDIVTMSQTMFEENGEGLWIARELDPSGDGSMLGFAGFWPFHDQTELLFGLAPDFFGRGYGTEMVAELLRYGFEDLEFEAVVGSTDPPNEASVRLMERLGMKVKKRETVDGLDTLFLEISRTEWEG